MYSVAILAGGLATRLRPLTEVIPKALVDVAGKPFIVRQLAYLREQGISHVVLCIGYLGNMVQDVVGSGESFGLKVSYSEDGPTLLGTGGALRKATSYLSDEFFVLYGDSFLPVNFSEVQTAYQFRKQPALMTVIKNQDQWDKSNVLFVEGQLIEYNKRTPRAEMAYIDYGLGVVTATLLEQHPIGQSFDLAEMYQDLSLRGQLAGLEVYERFYEIGSHTGLKETSEYFYTQEKK
jgi:N-acetyl-alpha-D-muramate 1-phosphate uridylyltransferase